MAFNDGFSTQGIPYITGSDGQVLTWNDSLQEWVAGEGIGSVNIAVNTTGGIIGDGTVGDKVRLDNNIAVQNLTVTNTASIAHLDTIYQQSLIVGDKYITLLSGSSTHAQMNGAGLLWGSGSTDGTTGDQGSVAYVLYRNDTTNQLEIFPGLKVSGNLNITGDFSGSASNLTNLPTVVDHVIYVAKDGNDSTSSGSLTDPFATISGALAYASVKYPDSSNVMIEIGPGVYSQDLTLTRYNTYLRSTAHRQEQRAVTVTGKTVVNSAAGDKYNRIIGIQGIFFNHNSLINPTVNVSGSTHLTYFKDCYFASNGANTFKIENVTTSSAKIVLANSIFLAQKGGADIIDIRGGDVKIDTVEVYFSSGSTGIGGGINQSGNSLVAADRVLIDLGTTITGSSYINSSTNYTGRPTLYLSNASLGSSQVTTNGALYSTNVSYLWNVSFTDNSKIKGALPSPVLLYSDLTSVNALTFETIQKFYLKDYMGDVTVNSLTSSTGISASVINGISVADFAIKSATQSFTGINTFTKDVSVSFGGSPKPNIFLYGGGRLDVDNNSYIKVSNTGYIESSGSIKVGGSGGFFSGSGTGLTNLSGSNWGPSNNFATDVRNQINAGVGIIYDKSLGVISSEEFQGVLTGSNLTGSGKDISDPIKLMDDISLLSVTASVGFSGSLLGTASYTTLAENALNAYTASYLGTRPAADYATTGSNIYNGNQTINGRINATSITGSFSGGTFNGTTVNATQITASVGFSGNGKNITGLSGSNWGTPNFATDVRNQLSAGTGINYNSLTGEIQLAGGGDGKIYVGTNLTGSGLSSGDPINTKDEVTIQKITASIGFSGTLYGTANYALNSDKLDNLDSTVFAKTASVNSFTANNTFTRLSASTGVSSSLYIGSGTGITNLSSSNWKNIDNFYSDVQDAFKAGAGILLNPDVDNRIFIETDIATVIKLGNGLTGSGTELDPIELKDIISGIEEITSSYFIGDLVGTADYANTASTLNGYLDNEFALLDNDVTFTSVTASLNGDGSEITNITASNISNFENDVKAIFSAGSPNITYSSLTAEFDLGNDIDVRSITASVGFSGSGKNLTDLTASSFPTFQSDVRNQLSAGNRLDYSSGQFNVKNNISLVSVSASFSGSGALISDLTGANWNGGTGSFFSDVRNSFVAGNGIEIRDYGDGSGRWEITSSGGGGGGGISSVYVDGVTISGSGDSEPNALYVLPNITLTSVTASFSGNGKNITNISASNWDGDFIGDVRSLFSTGSSNNLSYNNGVFDLDADISLTSVSASFSGSHATIANITGSLSGNVKSENIFAIDLTSSNVVTTQLDVNYVDFNTNIAAPGLQIGRMYYNTDTGDISTYLSSATGGNLILNNGQQLVQKCHNSLSTQINKGNIVHITTTANAYPPKIGLADWENDVGSANTLGVAMENIPGNSDGYVIIAGMLSGIDIPNSVYDAGDILYLSSSGEFTKVKPSAPKHIVSIGQVIQAGGNGQAYIKIQNGYELEELHDVLINGATNGQLLMRDSDNLWKNTSVLSGSYEVKGNLSGTTITASDGMYVPNNIVNNMIVTYAIEAEGFLGQSNYATTGSNDFTGNNTFTTVTASSIYVPNNIRINGTASIAHLETINQQSLVVGDKYIVILSGTAGNDHIGLDGAGLLYGSGSSGITLGDQQSHAYMLYRNAYDKLEIFPGLRVSGSLTSSGNVYVPQITASTGFSGSTYYGGLFSGSNFTTNVLTASVGISGSALYGNSLNVTTVSASNAISSSYYTGSVVSVSQVSASTDISASTYYGNGGNLINITAETAKNVVIRLPLNSYIGPGTIPDGKLVSISGSYLVLSDNNNDRKSNFIGIISGTTGTDYNVVVGGMVSASAAGGGTFVGGDVLYIDGNGDVSTYAAIPPGGFVTQIGIANYDVAASGIVILQPRIFGQKS